MEVVWGYIDIVLERDCGRLGALEDVAARCLGSIAALPQ